MKSALTTILQFVQLRSKTLKKEKNETKLVNEIRNDLLSSRIRFLFDKLDQ